MKPVPFHPVQDLQPGITVLEASAGTGKTFSITSLFLRLVAEQGLEVDQVLVVTFTVAATAQLKDRIRVRMQKAVDSLQGALDGEVTPEDIQDEVIRHLANVPNAERARRLWNLRTALSRMDDSAISTIHGFCRRTLERHPVETRVDLDAELVEADQDLLDEVTDDLYVSTLNAIEPALAQALRHEDFRSVVRRVLDGTRNHPDAAILPTAPGETPSPDPKAWLAWFRRFQDAWNSHGSEAVASLIEAIEQKRVDGRRVRRDWVEGRARNIETWLCETRVPFSWPPEELSFFDNEYLKSITKSGCVPPSHRLFDLVTEFRRRTDRLNEKFAAFRQALAHRLLGEVRHRLAARKRADRIWSFQDLLLHLRDGLRDGVSGEALAQAIRAQYRAALIDEFQDTDGIQWEIVRRVFDARDHYLFLIGDPKQAIYAFRGADIHAYLAARECANWAYTLDVNWRSDERWVRALNILYRRANRPFHHPGIEYVPVKVSDQHQEDRLRFPGQTPAPFVIRYVTRAPYGIEGRKPIRKGEMWRDLPVMVANDVARLLASGAEVRAEGSQDHWRPLGPRDIAILVRKHDQARAVQRALWRKGIPSVLYSEASVFESEAATDLALLLSAVADPEDRRAMKSALATRILGYGVPEVIAIESRDDEWEGWIGRFRRWGEAWREGGFLRMFRSVFHGPGVVERLLTEEGGERFVTDMLHLAEVLQKTESEFGYGPEALLTWLLRERSMPTGDAQTRQLRLESDEDAVEVVTMHRAKGLEYPVVFCPYLWDGHLRESGEAVVRFHDGGRTVLAARDLVPQGDWEQIQEQARREAFAENLRLAYVAITRARHQCYVYWAPAKDHETSALAWLLFPPGDGQEDGIEARSAALDDAGMLRELKALAEASGGTIAVLEADPSAEAPRVQFRKATPAEALRASDQRRDFDRSWQWTSFTRMVASRDGEHPGDDDAWRPPVVDGWGDALLKDFPRGRVAGRCLHRVFERLDFTRGDLEPVVREALADYGIDATAFTTPVCEAVRVALDTPLPGPDGPVRLRDVGLSDRLNEVAFLYPVAGGLWSRGEAVSGQDLAGVFERYGGRLGPCFAKALRDLAATRGFLSGQMDLVFRAGSRWYLLDYKSDNLGGRCSDYSRERLEREMVTSYYFLQYHLYAVALYRHASVRAADFDWDRDFGGVFYLFLRGLDGTGHTGVFFDRPSGTLVSALSAVLGGVP